MRKHTLITSLAAVMTITALTGCGSVDDPVKNTETQVETKEETVIETQTSISEEASAENTEASDLVADDKIYEQFINDELKLDGKTFSEIFSFMHEDFDMDPTIRPVLDLSEIQNGAEQLGGMFKTQNVDVTSTPMKNAQTISSLNQNYGTLGYLSNDSKMDDLISAVNKTADAGSITSTINNYITVSGAENPEDYANRLARQLKMQIRMG